MKHRKIFCILLAFCMMLIWMPSYTAFAVEADLTETAVDGEENVNYVGLIKSKSSSISAGLNKITLNCQTICNGVMAQVGFKEMYIQRSSNGTSGWYFFKFIGEDVVTNRRSYSISGAEHTVVGGYYCRVYMKHYAKNSAGTTEYSESYSNVVWVPAS